MPTALPMPFGDYTLEKPLASGGMAELYIARSAHPRTPGERVVLKRLNASTRTDPRQAQMLLAEARLLDRLRHDNIVSLLDFGEVDGEAFLVMSLVSGMDLAQVTSRCAVRGVVLPPEWVLTVAAAVLLGLRSAHEASPPVVHQDVSPENILVGTNGEVRLCDFGVSAALESESPADEHPPQGKLPYLSPEQVRGQAADPRSDLFSLGVSLFELLAGQHPSGGQGNAILDTLSSGTRYPSLGDVAPWYSPALVRCIDRAVAFDPAARYATATEFREDVLAILNDAFDGPLSEAALGSFVVSLSDPVPPARKSLLHRAPSRVPPSPKVMAARYRRIAWFSMGVTFLAILGFLWLFHTPVASPSSPEMPAELRLSQRVPVDPAAPPAPAPADAIPPATTPDTPPPSAAPEDAAAPPETDTAKPRVRTGTLDVNAIPWAEVRVGNKPLGTTPLLGISLPAGRHLVVFTHPDMREPLRKNVVIHPQQTTRLVVDLQPSMP